jgi:hypothetical protein
MALGLKNYIGNFSFPDIVQINFADFEMKLGMVINYNELQIQFVFHRYWSIFDTSSGPGTS